MSDYTKLHDALHACNDVGCVECPLDSLSCQNTMTELVDSVGERLGELKPPAYYDLKPAPIDVIKAWQLDFCLGNVVKYLAMAGKKPGEAKEKDLRKAMQYLRMELEDEDS